MMLYPTPSSGGIAKLQRFYQNEYGVELSEEQAHEILSGIMRFLYLTEIKPGRVTGSSAASTTGEENNP